MTNLNSITSVAITALALYVTGVAGQADQSELARQVLQGNRSQRLAAAEEARRIRTQDIGPELRTALITALEREGVLADQRRRGEINVYDHPELIARLAMVVAPLRDPASIHALAGALGASPPAVNALAQFGEAAAPAVLDVISRTADGSVLMDALLCLRYIAEGVAGQPLTRPMRDRIRQAARERLETPQRSVTTLWSAIDLAIALNDRELKMIVQLLAANRNEVIARGISNPDHISRTQKRAADRIAGIPALPRWAPPVER